MAALEWIRMFSKVLNMKKERSKKKLAFITSSPRFSPTSVT